MSYSFYDITLYTPTPYQVGSPEYWEETSLINFVSDLYVRKMYGYKPPNTTRITIQPYYHDIWNRTWKNGSIVTIAPYFNHDEFAALGRMEKYKYILDIINVSTIQLSNEYNWDKTVFERAYAEIIADNFMFKLAYPTKMSRDKRAKANITIDKTETKTTIGATFELGSEIKNVSLVTGRNWFWYDLAYRLAKHSHWKDSKTFGIHHKKAGLFLYHSLVDNNTTGNITSELFDLPA